MGLKRKRSSEYTYSPTSSSGFSASSCASSSPSPNPLHLHLHPARPELSSQMELDFSISKPFRHFDDASGRTRKRWRDRPNEHAIHERTIQKLFNAQREHPNAEPIMSYDDPVVTQPPVVPQKSTLHAFWNIRQPQPIFTVPTLPEEALGPRCEDCDRSLVTSKSPEAQTSHPEDLFSCHACGRNICDFCAVNYDGRRCLECVQEGRR